MSQQFQLEVGFLSDVGQVRDLNEDCWGIFDSVSKSLDLPPETVARKGRLHAVADGMGGHAAGEVASKRAIAVLFQQYYEDPDVDLVRSVERAFWAANAEIYAQAATHPEQNGMGTTLVSAIIQGDELVVANVGDSRAYIVRSGQIEQISRDHSWVNEQVEAGLLSEAEAQSHMYRNIITRSLGSRPDVAVDTFSQPLHVGDSVVLCTDGVSNELAMGEIGQIVSASADATQAAAGLITLANQRGGADNLTAIVVRIAGDAVQPLAIPWWKAGVAAGAVVLGLLVACLVTGLLPTALRPQLWSSNATPSPTPVIVVGTPGTNVSTPSPQATKNVASVVGVFTVTLPGTIVAPMANYTLTLTTPYTAPASSAQPPKTTPGSETPGLLPVFSWQIGSPRQK